MSTVEEIEGFLSHHGVKGQKWGIRKQAKHDLKLARIQSRVDRTARIAGGTASKTDRILGSALTAKGAQRQLQRSANAQAKYAARVKAGKAHTNERILNKLGAVKITEINYHAKGDANAKMDNGQKAALGVLVAAGALHIALHR